MSESNSLKINQEEPLVTFAIISDIQYADIDDLVQYGRYRYYRNSLELTKRAVQDWKKHETEYNCKMKFILQLGDISDGRMKLQHGDAVPCIYRVLNELQSFYPEHDFNKEYKMNSTDPPKILHCFGNHEVFCVLRRDLLNMPVNTSRILKQNNQGNYYWYDITDKLRLICLDQYEISTLGHEPDDEVYKKAKDFMDSYAKIREECSDLEMKNYYLKYTVYNGAITDRQFEWLKEQLDICSKSNKKVLLCGHIPLLKEAADYHVCWNSEDILKLIWSYPKLVVAYLCGHCHPGGYFLDDHGVHHLTMRAILETPLESDNSYAIAKVYDNRLVIKNQSPFGSFEVVFK